MLFQDRHVASSRDLHIQEFELLLLGQRLEVEANILLSTGDDEVRASLAGKYVGTLRNVETCRLSYTWGNFRETHFSNYDG